MDALFGLLFVFMAILLWRRSTSSRTVAAAIGLGVFLTLLLFVGYFVSHALTGEGIDASVVYHLSTGWEGAPTADFAALGLAAVAMLVVTIAVSIYACQSSRTENGAPLKRTRAFLALGLASASVYLNPASDDIAAVVRSAQALTKMPKETGTAPELFATIEQLSFGDEKKNFVLLYLESLERSYFDEGAFPDLMPNLVALQEEALSFTDITEVSEAGWTIAAMVASQCGMPLTGSGTGVDEFLPGATCLGDLLSDAGYNLNFMGGADLSFAGKGAFYQTHGFDRIEGREELKRSLDDPEYLSNWGLYDDSLYEQATQRFDRLAATEEPFGLVLLTVDTHHPFGYISRSCGEEVYRDGSNRFLNAVHCADKMAADFIRRILESSLAEDTILIVMSDHMAMPNMAWDQLQETKRRNLLFVFAPGIEPGLSAKPGTTFDVAPTLLGLIGSSETALGYGRDLLGVEPTLRGGDVPLASVLDEGGGYLASMWAFPRLSEGLKIDEPNDRLVLGDRFLKLPALLLLNDDLEIAALHFGIDSEISLIERIGRLPTDQRFIWVDTCAATALLAPASSTASDRYCSAFGTLGSAELETVAMFSSTHVDLQEIEARFAANPTDEDYDTPRLVELLARAEFAAEEVVAFTPRGMIGDIAVRSAGYTAGESWVLNREAGERVKLIRGLTLLGLNADETPVKIGHKDTCSYGNEEFDKVRLGSDLKAAIEINKELFGAFLVVGHNSVVCYQIDPGLDILFSGTAFEAWRDVWYEQPYVAVITGDGEVQEFVGERRTALGVELRDFIKQRDKVAQRALRWLPRVAHAGGAFNGLTYTNSLDALNANANSYELFEIDFSWTSDGHLVCLHDWEQPFLASSGIVTGDPMTLNAFEAVAQQVAAFQPCTLSSLAEWLRDHPDARIVLDLKANVVEAYRHIAESHPDLQSRFIPQIYQPEIYYQIRSLGYEDIIWTLYRYEGGISDVLTWLSNMDLLGLTMAPEWVDMGLPARAQERTGVLSWVHTVNTRTDLDRLVETGAAEIYTDFITPGDFARFELVSAGSDAGPSRAVSIESGGEISLARGVNLVGLSKGRKPEALALFDGCAVLDTGAAPDPAPFREAFKSSSKAYDALAVIIHESAVCENVTLEPVLSGTGLTEWDDIGYRQPYIGLIAGADRVLEFASSEGSRLVKIVSIDIRPE